MNDWKIIVILLIFLFLVTNVVQVGSNEMDLVSVQYGRSGCDGILDQFQGSYDGFFSVDDDKYYAQSFIPSMRPLAKIEAVVVKGGLINKNLIVSIREDLFGNDLTSVSIPSSSIPFSISWIEVDFQDIIVIPEKTYYIVMRVDEPCFSYYRWYCGGSEGNDLYKRGNSFNTWHGSWGKNADYVDFAFRTYAPGTNSKPTDPIISGPEIGVAYKNYTYSFKSTDPDNQDVYYIIDWGDGTVTDWLGPYRSGEYISLSHMWSEYQGYTIMAISKDIMDDESDWSSYSISMAGHPPEKPTIKGPTVGKPRNSYTFSVSSFDVDEDKISYFIDWDDGHNSGWRGPYDSGDEVNFTHEWNKKGLYSVKVKAKDSRDLESDWSNPLSISMPKNKAINPFPMFLRFLENHPHLFPVLRNIFEL